MNNVNNEHPIETENGTRWIVAIALTAGMVVGYGMMEAQADSVPVAVRGGPAIEDGPPVGPDPCGCDSGCLDAFAVGFDVGPNTFAVSGSVGFDCQCDTDIAFIGVGPETIMGNFSVPGGDTYAGQCPYPLNPSGFTFVDVADIAGVWTFVFVYSRDGEMLGTSEWTWTVD